MSVRCTHVLALLPPLWACQGRPSESTPALPAAIELHDASGVTARVVAGHPCRATVEGVELLVGGRPLIAQLGSVRWTGDDAPNGTTLRRDNTPTARILDTTPGAFALFDPEGIPLIRATLDPDGKRATISDRAGVVVRYVVRSPAGLVVQSLQAAPEKTVTGTNDLLLAAVLSASEALPEVRGLSACHRLFPLEKAP